MLVPDQGSLAELQAQLGDEWVHLYRGDLTAETLSDAAAGPAPDASSLVGRLLGTAPASPSLT